jgi:hypothetical protein
MPDSKSPSCWPHSFTSLPLADPSKITYRQFCQAGAIDVVCQYRDGIFSGGRMIKVRGTTAWLSGGDMFTAEEINFATAGLVIECWRGYEPITCVNIT